jgi:hypothetical protein
LPSSKRGALSAFKTAALDVQARSQQRAVNKAEAVGEAIGRRVSAATWLPAKDDDPQALDILVNALGIAQVCNSLDELHT